MFDKILIANRGEIACRIIRTARRLGVATVAVCSDADADALHVRMADEAVRIGPAAARDSYLRHDAVIAACQRTGAQAVHPGYGFLSENAEFAEACAAAGITFIGPPPAAIRAMGSKSESKRIMESAGVPLVPGYHGSDQDDATLSRAADDIGYPVLVKASAGGGGKGMRIVRAAADLPEALAGARREACAAFGDDTMLIEKLLERPRHVEMQVFGDSHGNYVHLFERDCSLQRRHQKVIEEAPAPGLPEDVRARLGEAAIAAAHAVGYVGAGTVEFLYQDGAFFFIEMNTRLQVEHPVTEMITGQDLVEWQLGVAAGGTLPCAQADLAVRGHAFEARIYAEDPERDFLPSTGRIHHLRTPPETEGLRIDSGIVEGDAVSIHYDPMIAKLVVWGPDRAAALHRLRAALAGYQIVGPATNLAFLSRVAAHPAFARAALTTHFIDNHRDALVPVRAGASDAVLALAVLDLLEHARQEAAAQARAGADPSSPWHLATGWRMNGHAFRAFTFLDGEARHRVGVRFGPDAYTLDLPGGRCTARAARASDGDLVAELDGQRLQATVVCHDGNRRSVFHAGRAHLLLLDEPGAAGPGTGAASGSLSAPMPGLVTQVSVAVGDKVTSGQALMVLEAMKMEHTITAPLDGTVTEVNFAAGSQVGDGDVLLSVAAAAETA
ncbi:acetyl/propionyl/methylcrotonyl-CoA carboxylase subunit alpha [Alkalilacustris brevis]|uniref:acetyl/propionyl/methylcrotonyl-CoA carboxylase subunit alpha n=1 Tax=Alkalilacustris brevis TaxID=2026338 RepID=UPI000E0D0E12|nr:acetyl-CoA carboxylase biotin carboxylase subunit [Alkalilacustris brevis]